jgi:hypothetical protein
MLVEGENTEILKEQVGDTGTVLPAGLVRGDNLVVPIKIRRERSLLVKIPAWGTRYSFKTKILGSYLVAMLEWMTPGAKSPPAFSFLIKSEVLTRKGVKREMYDRLFNDIVQRVCNLHEIFR